MVGIKECCLLRKGSNINDILYHLSYLFFFFTDFFTNFWSFNTDLEDYQIFTCLVKLNFQIYMYSEIFFCSHWNLFSIDMNSLKTVFVQVAFLFSLTNILLGSTGDFILVWCLFLVGPCKGWRCKISTV